MTVPDTRLFELFLSGLAGGRERDAALAGWRAVEFVVCSTAMLRL
jgi:hypothetical protein